MNGNQTQPDNFMRFVIVGIIVVILLALYLGFLLLRPNLANLLQKSGVVSPKISANILFLTQPVFNLSGTIIAKDSNSFTLRQSASYETQPLTSLAGGTTALSPLSTISAVTKTIDYQIFVTNQTKVVQFPLTVPYLFRPTVTTTNQPSTAGLDQLTPGQTVSLTTTTDLRTTDPRKVTAETIQLPQIPNVVTGKIESISGNTLTVRGTPTIASTATTGIEEKVYTLTIDSETEISYYQFTESVPVPTRQTANDLKVGTSYRFYTDVDVLANSQAKVLRIELDLPPVNLPQPTITPAQTP